MSPRPTLVIGAGIAGLATARELCRAEVPVLLLSATPATESESLARHDGIDAATGDEESIEEHIEDLVAAAGEGAQRGALAALARAAPAIVARLGLPLEKDRIGKIARSRLPGSRSARTLHAGARTALHVGRQLSRELLAHQQRGLLELTVGQDLVELVLDEAGRVAGVITREWASGEHHAFAADGVCLATGGCAGLFMQDTFAHPRLGAAMGLAVRHGARLAPWRGVSPCPFAYASGGFVRRLPARLAALGAKVEAGLLDLSSLDRMPLRRAVGSALEAYARHTGRDAYSTPIPMVSTPDRSLVGLQVGFDDDPKAPVNHATTLPGLWAVGGAVNLYFGQAPGSGTPLLAALFGAERAALALRSARGAAEIPASRLEQARARVAGIAEERLAVESDAETPFQLRTNLVGRGPDFDLGELESRLARAPLGDSNPVANAALALWFELDAARSLLRALEVPA